MYRDTNSAEHASYMTGFDATGRGHKPAGTNTGGQFDGRTLTRPPSGSLEPARPTDAQQIETTATAEQSRFLHRAELIEQGYAPAQFTPSRTNVKSTEGIRTWWSEHFINAEHGSKDSDGATYPVIPDDYTPRQTFGLALSGKRRTHRIKYEGEGYAVRMPSATAIKRFADESGSNTFDVPVQASRTLPDGRESTTTGYVRVTRNGPSSWHTEPLGLGDQSGAVVGESVSTILEARHPSIALKDAGNLYQKYQHRKANQGSELAPLKRPSSFVNGIAYNQQHGEIYVRLGERQYGYRFPQAEAAYKAMQMSHSPGRTYNEYIKKLGGGHFEVTSCDSCGRTYRTERGHSCTAQRAATAAVKPHRARIAARILTSAARMRSRQEEQRPTQPVS